MDRRTAIGLGLLGAGALSARAAGAPVVEASMAADGSLPTDSRETRDLWPGVPPGGAGIVLTRTIIDASAPPHLSHRRSVSGIQTPQLIVYRPAAPAGMALLVIPGGGYISEAMEWGDTAIARRFNAAGITCFILRYRLPAEGWANRADVPLQDAQRAVRLIRADAEHYGIDPARLAVVGFSAGGHVASMLATRWDANVYAPVDAADRLDARPLAVNMMYPVITMGAGTHPASREKLLGPQPAPAVVAAYSSDRQVRAGMPPCFLCFALDDDVVPPMQNGMAMFVALRAANIPTELHAFQQGGHGFSLHGAEGKPCAAWSELFLAWAATQGFAPR